LAPLWQYLDCAPDPDGLPLWELYPRLETGILKLADGCPFKCTYCSVPQVYPQFKARPMERVLRELEQLLALGVKNVAFYDDALLFQPERILEPFLREVLRRGIRVNFHTPNALNARFISPELAGLMIEAGFKVFYLGFESSAYEWQRKTGGKVYSHELTDAVNNLLAAGAEARNLSAYLILGHPNGNQQHVADSMRFAHDQGLRVMLSEFSPIPGTPDGELCRQWIDLDEPLNHNKTSFPILFQGVDEINRMKNLAHELNRELTAAETRSFEMRPSAVHDTCVR
jgi:tRNA A37 methylthiotransferase MiaB